MIFMQGDNNSGIIVFLFMHTVLIPETSLNICAWFASGEQCLVK